MFRIGHGYDIHRLAEQSRDAQVVIGGITIAHDKSVVAHSDGDIAIHALIDAILGALGLGDIGHYFPDTDSQYHQADSKQLLAIIVDKMHQADYQLHNADISLIVEKPKLAPYIGKMRTILAEICQVPISDINIKATTNEKIDGLGQNRAIAAHAVVLLRQMDEK